jgi:hypothetical protein
VEENPHTGTTEQIVTLSLAIAEASTRLDKSTFALFKEETDIGDKVFSKLKKIGETFQGLNEKERRDVIQGLPASYSTIHVLCSISPAELVTGIKSKNITPATSIRAAKDYTTQIRFPGKSATDGEKGRWGAKQEQIFSVFRPELIPLEGEALTSLEEALRRVCVEHGVVLRQASTANLKTLVEEERERAGCFWKAVMEKELPTKWFAEQSDELKKQFNIRTIDELRNTPALRSFTGFLTKADGGTDGFWKKHGQAYVAKLHFLMETTEDRAQRYNWKIRLEQVFERHNELAIWNNVVMKNSGLFYRQF